MQRRRTHEEDTQTGERKWPSSSLPVTGFGSLSRAQLPNAFRDSLSVLDFSLSAGAWRGQTGGLGFGSRVRVD